MVNEKLNNPNVIIDDTPVDFSFAQRMTEAEYKKWVLDGCPTPYNSDENLKK